MRMAKENPANAAVRYLRRRVSGHPKLEALALPALDQLQGLLERLPPPQVGTLGKGQQAYGAPSTHLLGPTGSLPLGAVRLVNSAEALQQAMSEARAGDVLELAPGEYSLPRSLGTPQAGTANRPITVRAARPGTAFLHVRSRQGVIVTQPHWIFENLNWVGRCDADDDCEHAIHVMGRGHSVRISNNEMRDFSAALKVNGEGGHWPDGGVLQYSTLVNTRPRQTSRPVALVDIVGASHWQVLDNVVRGFGRDRPGDAYGVFMKGGGEGGRIERNLVICNDVAQRHAGSRIGLSLGDGGTAPEYCRGGCNFEHRGGRIINNVIAHCNDVGVDVSRSTGALVLHNTLVNTQGMLTRNAPSDARFERNLGDGRIYSRRGTEAVDILNLRRFDLSKLLAAPDSLDLRWLTPPEALPTDPRVPGDFCGEPRGPSTFPGATGRLPCGNRPAPAAQDGQASPHA
jgi:hypothetical protein